MVWFEILGHNEAVEYRTVGSYWTSSVIKASILPERLLIQDLLQSKDGYHEISASEFHLGIEQLKKNFKYRLL